MRKIVDFVLDHARELVGAAILIGICWIISSEIADLAALVRPVQP